MPGKEFSLRATILGLLISLILVGANGYLSLKVGLTIAASIPSAIGAIVALRLFKNGTIYEANIIQAIASSGEAVIAAAVFTVPALIILRFWHYFHFWETCLLTLLGGILGVLFSIPLRRILLKEPQLIFPEAQATTEILKLSRQTHSTQNTTFTSRSNSDIRFLVLASFFATLIKIFQSGFRIFAENFEKWFAKGHIILGFGFDFSPALLGVGYIIGLPVTIAIFVGSFTIWMLGLPLYSFLYHTSILHHSHQIAMRLWEHQLRYVGIGVMLIAVLHTLIKLASPIYQGIQFSIQSFLSQTTTKIKIASHDKDIPIAYILLGLILTFAAVFVFLRLSVSHIVLPLGGPHYFPIVLSLLFLILMAFIFAMVSGYLAGLIGTSNLPVSGLTVLSLLLSSMMLILCGSIHTHTHLGRVNLSAFIIIMNAILTAILSTSGLHMQCLKITHMIKGSPFKQELAYMLGIIPGALLIVPIMQLMFSAYGIAGVFPHAGMNASEMLSAPQATLIAETTIGILSGKIPWMMLVIGMILASGSLGLNSMLKRHKIGSFSPMAFGLGMFLPPGISGPLVAGGLIAYLSQLHFKKKKMNLACQHQEKTISKIQLNQQVKELETHQENLKRRGLLIGCGFIAGESISGILLAIPFVIAGNSDVLSIMPIHYSWIAEGLGIFIFAALIHWMYRKVTR